MENLRLWTNYDVVDHQNHHSLEYYDRPANVIKFIVQPYQARRCLRHIEKHHYTFEGIKFIGYDAEWTPWNSKLQLIQIACSDNTTFLIKGFNAINEMRHLLEKSHIYKVGSGLNNDLRVMHLHFGNFEPNNSFIDLQDMVRTTYPSITRRGLRNLTATLLGKQLHKDIKHSKWHHKNYSNEMVKYAANDANVSVDLFLHILNDAIVTI